MPYSDFTQSVIKIIKKIPKGKVMSYGLIAAIAGNPRGARQVSWILHSLTHRHKLPWWRVVNYRGKISIEQPNGKEEQALRLREEGVAVSEDYEIDINRHMWKSS